MKCDLKKCLASAIAILWRERERNRANEKNYAGIHSHISGLSVSMADFDFNFNGDNFLKLWNLRKKKLNKIGWKGNVCGWASAYEGSGLAKWKL